MLLAVSFAWVDTRVRALDAAPGSKVWSDGVAAPALLIPAVVTQQGAADVVVAVGGSSILEPQVADQVIDYRLCAP